MAQFGPAAQFHGLDGIQGAEVDAWHALQEDLPRGDREDLAAVVGVELLEVLHLVQDGYVQLCGIHYRNQKPDHMQGQSFVVVELHQEAGCPTVDRTSHH